MTGTRTSKSTKDAISSMAAAMRRFEWDMRDVVSQAGRVPDVWREVWQNRTRRKKRVTFWMDEDVLKLFRSMGPGYGPRMNDVLRSFMYARMGSLLEGEDLVAEYREEWMGEPKPDIAALKVRYQQMLEK